VVEASGRISRRVASRRGEQRLRARERRGEGGKRKRQKVVRTRFGKFVCRLHPRMSRSAGEKRTPQLARTFAPTPSIPVSLPFAVIRTHYARARARAHVHARVYMQR